MSDAKHLKEEVVVGRGVFLWMSYAKKAKIRAQSRHFHENNNRVEKEQ